MATGAPPEILTEDRLLDGRVVLRQPKHGFRVAIDSVLLAAAVPAAAGERILEPGAGIGGAALALAARVPGCTVAGFEVQRRLVRIAGENIRLNAMAGRVDIAVGDLADPPSRFALGAFDHVMMNPPHLPAGRARAPADASRAASHVEGGAGLAEWIAFGVRMLRVAGTLTLVHRAERLGEILAALDGRAGGAVVFPFWPRGDGSPAKRIVVRAERGSAAPLRLAPGMVLHGGGGGYTDAADRVLRGAALAL